MREKFPKPLDLAVSCPWTALFKSNIYKVAHFMVTSWSGVTFTSSGIMVVIVVGASEVAVVVSTVTGTLSVPLAHLT